MGNIFQQIQQLWGRWNPRQRLLAGGGALLTLVVLGAILKNFATPEYKPLMTGLEPADAQALSAQLAAKKIPFELTPDGKGINVSSDQLDNARMEIAAEGSPHSGRMGFELFDKSSWGQTEFDEKVNYQRALEGELERTIQTLSGVKSARVHLVMPTSSVFLDRERSAKASVTLRMKHGSLSADQISAIGRLVSGAVDNLSPRDVTIIDADSNESLGGKTGSMEGSELEGELTRRLMATLGPAVGADNLRTSVNVEYDLTSSEQDQERYDPANSAVLTSQKTSEQIGPGAGVGGVAGTAANLPNAGGAQVQAGDENAQLSSSENATFGVNKTVVHTVSPAGRIRRISAAILVNDAVDRKLIKGKWVTTPRKRTPAQLEQLADLARGVLGVDKDRGDIVTVQNITFDADPFLEATPTVLQQVKQAMTDFATPIRYAALLMLFIFAWALLFRPIQKQVLQSMKEIAPGGSAPALLQSAAVKREIAATNGENRTDADADFAQVKQELAELVLAEPAIMARTLQTWLREDRA